MYEISKVNEGNIDTPLTNFPVSIDGFDRMSDVTLATLPYIIEYNNYMNMNNIAAASQVLVNHPELKECLLNAEKWNELRDAIISLEYYLLNQVDELYNNIVNSTIGINDNPTEEESTITSYSASKIDTIIQDVNQTIDDHVNAENPHKIKSVEHSILSDEATKLENSRTIQIDLSLAEGRAFDGTSDVNPGVKNILPVANGGTGYNSVDTTPTSNSNKMVTSGGVYTALSGKQANITGGASTITSSNLTANRALISNGSGKVAISAVTNTELGYLDGVTSNIQTQLNGKAASGHTHDYAASSHNQAASTITAGTLAGKVLANAEAVKTLGNKQVRNIYAGTSEITSLTYGDIYVMYE